MRFRQGLSNQALEARVASSNFTKYSSATSRCVGGVWVFGEIEFKNAGIAVLDTSMDWRDRLCVVHAQMGTDGTSLALYFRGDLLFPQPRSGPAAFGFRCDGLFYTAKGWTGNDADTRGTGLNWAEFYDSAAGTLVTHFVIYADSVTGELKMRCRTNPGFLFGGTYAILAFEQLGLKVSLP